MNALITGITGFVGSHLSEYLLSLGDMQIHGLARWRSPKDNIKHIENEIHLHYGDLTDYPSIFGIINDVKPDFVFHLAAQSVAEDEFIPILKSKSMELITFGELWKTCSKRNNIKSTVHNGIETEIINIKNSQIRAISFFSGMGNWLPIQQITRHKYNGDIVELKQKFGSIKVTPNHCVIDKYGQLASPMDNPELLPMRKINYYNKNEITEVRIKTTRKYKKYKDCFFIPNIPNKRIPVVLSGEKLDSFTRFCAAYISEGCAHSRVKRKNFTVTISNQNKEWLAERNKELQHFSEGITGRYSTGKKSGYKDVFSLTITSELLYDIITKYCGRLSEFKQIPNFIFRLPKEKQLDFLRVLAEGDGCYEERQRYDILRYTTSSRKLAAQLCLLLTLIGKDYTIYENGAFFIRECGFYQPRQGVTKRTITTMPYEGYVYDISIGGPEIFAAGVGNLIIHNSYVPYSFQAPVTTLDVNCQGTCNLLEAIKLSRVNGIDPIILVCSSSEVYGQVLPDEVPINESCQLRPASPYAVSKVCEDMLGFQYYLSWGLKVIRSRMFTHCGPRRGDVFVGSNFAKQIAQIEKGKQEPVIKVGNLDSIRTFADVRDVVKAYWLMVNKCSIGEVYNIGGNETMSIKEMLNRLMSFSTRGDIKIEVDASRLRPSDVTLQIPDCSKFKKETGWQPEISIDQMLNDMLNYWRLRV